jgi:hypothetical protein
MKKLLTLVALLPLFANAQFCGTYVSHSPISYTGLSNFTISGDSINGGGATVRLIYLTNCTNVHITKCKFTNNLTYAINLNGCTNVTIDSCFFDNVAFGVYATHSPGTKTNNNYFRNIKGTGSPVLFGHAVQYDNCNGGGIQINYNKVNEIPGQSDYTHDQLSVYQCNGLVGDSIQIIGNWIKGGQLFQVSGDGAAGIVPGDAGGSYQVVRGNILVNALAILVTSDASSIKVDHNKIYASVASNNSVGILIDGSGGNTNYVGYNQINFTSANGTIINWYIFPGVPTPIGWSTNTALHTADAGAYLAMIPTPMVTPCATLPNISYTPSSNTYRAGTTIGVLNVSNTGGAVTSSYTVSPALPIGLILNAVSGQISGTPTSATSTSVYVVTASNSGGVAHFNLSLTITPPPVALPAFTYSPNNNIYVIPQTVSLSPVSTGGAIVSYSVTPALPSGLSLSATTGIISGTVSSVSSLTTYTIVGINASGSGRTTIQLTVNPNPVTAPNISYSPATISATYGVAIASWVPVNLGSGATWTVSPALPLGFGINPTTGVISGVPTNIQGSTNYVVTAANASGSSNFTISISIAQHHLTITALGQQKYLNTPNPALTYDVTGLVNGDQINTALTTLPTLSTTAVLGSPVGNYPITANSAASTNYSISYQDGTLSVVHPNNAIRFRVFGGIVPIP